MAFPFSRISNIFAQPQDPEEMARKRFLSSINPPGQNAPTFEPPDPPSSIKAMPYIQAPPAPPQDEASRYFDEMERVRKNTPALSAYQQAVTQMPTEANTPVSTKRKVLGTIAGGMAGFAAGPKQGAESAENIIEDPYRKAMGDYKNRIAGLGESAALEEKDKQSQLSNLSSARALGLKYDEFKLKTLENEQKQGVEQEKLRISGDRAKAYIKEHGDPKYDHVNQADGSILAINKSNPNDRRIIPASTVAAATAKTGQRNAATNERNAATAEKNAASLAKYREGQLSNAAKTLELKAKAGKVVSPSQQAYAVDNALRGLASNPHFSKHVKQNPNGTYDMKEDDGSLVYQEFKKRVKTLAESSIKAGTPFDDEEDSGESPVTIGKPREE